MDPETILKLITAGAKLAQAAGPIIAQASTVFTKEDEAKIRAALSDLQAHNDVLHGHVQGKLRG